MGYDLGATVPLGFDVRDSAGALANASTITLAITLPDGTTAAGTTVTNPPAVTGQYSYEFATTQPGRHVVRATTTGPATAYTDVFYVRQATTAALVSLADVKAHLNITATTDDAELRDAILTASDVVEGICGAVARRTVVETHSGRGQSAIVLDHPAISIVSVTEHGATVAADGYSLSDAGVLYRSSGYSDLNWRAGRGNIVVTYVAGRADQLIPAAIADSVKELVRINFRQQVGGNYSPFDGGPSDDLAGTTRLGFFVPNKIVTLLQRHAATPGFA